MSDTIAKKPPPRPSAHVPPKKPKAGPAPRPHDRDTSSRASEDKDAGSINRRSPEGRSTEPKAGVAKSPPHGEKAPTQEGNAPPKQVVRLTLSEAADEIKRLRRIERQNNAQKKQLEDDIRNCMEETNRLKEQLQNIEREREEEKAIMEEEKANLISMYESDTKKLKGQLKENSDGLRLLQETSLPLLEARKLTFKALRKGRALQYMAQLYTSNTVLMTVKREALHKLLENAIGTDYAVFRATHGFACGVQSYSDSHLRLLRQEQLILLAENERLQAQIQDMQQRTEHNRRDRLKQQESTLVRRDDMNLLSHQAREASISMRSIGESRGPFHTERAELQGAISSRSISGGSAMARNVEMGVAGARLRSITGVLCIAEMRLLAYGFRRLSANCLNESIVQSMQTTVNRSLLAFRNDVILRGSSLVMSVVRANEKASTVRAFWIMMLNSKAGSQAEKFQVANNQRNPAQGQAATSEAPNYSSTCRACQWWSVELSQPQGSAMRPLALRQRGDPSGGFGIAPSQGGGIPPPVAYAPHYFRDLPSTQKRRNMYFTTTPPRVPQQGLLTTTQRARNMALTQETFYRTVTAGEGWKRPGANGFGIGIEPLETVVGYHATSRDNKLDAANNTLKGTLQIPQTTPSSQPLSAAERNDAYMEQLLNATDQRLKLQ